MQSNNGASPHDWREARRRRGFELLEEGWRQSEIAAALGVSRAAVCQWAAARAADGLGGWRSHSSPGAPAKLAAEELRLLPDLLSHGAEAYGFCGEVWTCA